MKVCSKCRIEKSKSAFGRNKNYKDGLRYKCRECRRVSSKKYYGENIETIMGKRELPENKKGRKRNHKRWRSLPGNKEKFSKTATEWAKKNPDKVAKSAHKRRAKKYGNGGSYTAEEWQGLVQEAGNICLCCGISGEEVLLTVDHVIPISRGGMNDISNLQPLCQSCNSSKSTKSTDYRVSY